MQIRVLASGHPDFLARGGHSLADELADAGKCNDNEGVQGSHVYTSSSTRNTCVHTSVQLLTSTRDRERMHTLLQLHTHSCDKLDCIYSGLVEKMQVCAHAHM